MNFRVQSLYLEVWIPLKVMNRITNHKNVDKKKLLTEPTLESAGNYSKIIITIKMFYFPIEINGQRISRSAQ